MLRRALPVVLVQLGVDDEAVPEALEKVENEAGLAVEEAEQDDITEGPVEQGAEEAGRAPVEGAFEESPARRLRQGENGSITTFQG